MALNYAAGGTGALSGAATGATIGSAIPGVGTAIGAGVGGIIGGAAGLFGNRKKKKKRLSTFDKQQQQLYGDSNQAIYGQGPLSDLYNFDANAANANFDLNVANPEYRNFRENVIPEITGEFRGKGLQNSSYAGEALTRAGRDLQETLAAKRSDMIYKGGQAALDRKGSAVKDALGMSTFAYNTSPNEQSSLDKILGEVGPAAGEWFADYLKSKGSSSTTNPLAGASSAALK